MRLSRYLCSDSRLEKMGYRQTTLERLLETISWKCFKQGESLIGFKAMKQQSSTTIRLHQAELTILIWGSKGGEIHQNDKLVQNPSHKRNPDNEPSQKGFDGGYEIMSRCIAFENPE
jgi:hypothetical protein